MRAVILAGGMGIRLRPFTFSIPKPLLPLGDEPILQIIIKRLKKFGFSDFILAVGYKSKMLEAYFGNGSSLGVNIRYLQEKKPLGTAGPLALLREKYSLSDEETILLMNGDIMTRLNFSKMLNYHRKSESEVTMGIKTIAEKNPYGFVEASSGRVKKVTEKPSFKQVINTGIYLINAGVIKEVPRGRFFTMPQLINKLISEGRPVGAYTIKEYWMGLEDLQNFEDLYSNKYARGAFIRANDEQGI